MKLLLDEQLPQDLRHAITGHEVVTVGYAGLAGLKNGRLLRAAAERGFDALITNDQDLEHQQNLTTLPLAVVVIQTRANKLEAILPILPSLHRTLSTLVPKTLIRVEAE